MTEHTKVPAYKVVVGDACIESLRTPAAHLGVGEGDNVMAANERRVARHCIAVLGTGDPFTWQNRDAALYAARCDPAARVVEAGTQQEEDPLS